MVSAHIHVQLLQSIKLTTFLWCWILFVNEPWPQGKSHSRAKFINNSTNVKDAKSGSRHKWKTNRWSENLEWKCERTFRLVWLCLANFSHCFAEFFCRQYAAIIKINTPNMMSVGHKSVSKMCEVEPRSWCVFNELRTHCSQEGRSN